MNKLLKCILLLSGLLGASSQFAYAAAPVQKTSVYGGGVSTEQITLNGVAAGDTLILIIGRTETSSGALSSLTDSNGTPQAAITYALATIPSTWVWGMGVYYVPNAAAGTHTFTVDFATTENTELYLAEYAGKWTFDAASPIAVSGTGGGTNAASASITPAANGELLVGTILANGTASTFSSWGSGMTQEDTLASGPVSAWADVTQTTAAAASASATISTTSVWAAAIAAFKPATLGPSKSQGFFF